MKKQVIYEGQAKTLYEADNESLAILEFKDEMPTHGGKKTITVRNKGVLNTSVASHLMRLLDSYHIPTSFLKHGSEKSLLVQRVDIIPLEIRVRNIAAGSLVKRYGVKEGKELECPIIEYYLKESDSDDTMINEDHIVSFGHATSEEIKEIHRLASKINAILKDFFRRRNYKLVDTKLEFGRLNDKVVVGGDLSLDTIRLWDLESDEKRYDLSAQMNATKLSEVLEQMKKRIFLEE